MAAPARPGQGTDRIVQRATAGAGHVLQLLQAARANAARRKVHHPHEAGVVVGVLQQAQVGQRVLDLGALKEAQAAVHAVGHAGIEERRLNHPALRIAAVEHGNLLALGLGPLSRTSCFISSTIHCASAKSVGAS